MKLEFQNVSVKYQKRQILQNVSFCVEEHSLTALIGRNGAGKSTLISCLTGEKQDYTGSILLDGKEIRSLSANERARQLACLSQNLPRVHVTVRELVSFGRTPHLPFTGKLSVHDVELIDSALEAVGLTDMQDKFVDTLSGGERKKAFFAMTLAQDAPLILLDEPTAHLDTISRFEMLALADQMRKQYNKTFLIVLHELPEVLRCADRIVALHEKQVVFGGSADECLQQQIPQQFFKIKINGDAENGYSAMPL